MWTIYDHPKDFPDAYIARRYVIGMGGNYMATNDVVLAMSLDEIRRKIPQGLSRIQRDPWDDDKIVETWL